jgi:hypothetical protein
LTTRARVPVPVLFQARSEARRIALPTSRRTGVDRTESLQPRDNQADRLGGSQLGGVRPRLRAESGFASRSQCSRPANGARTGAHRIPMGCLDVRVQQVLHVFPQVTRLRQVAGAQPRQSMEMLRIALVRLLRDLLRGNCRSICSTKGRCPACSVARHFESQDIV